MKSVDKQYLKIAKKILLKGEERADRTGTGTISLFSPPKIRVDLQKGFPLLTTKALHIPSIVHELLWFLKGDTNIKYLLDNHIKIWTPDAYRDFTAKGGELSEESFIKLATKQGYDLGPIYGRQWRDWNSIDQIKELINGLKQNPTSRRHIVNAWNVNQLKYMALPPCHVFFQCYVSNDGGLSLQMYQRSADWFLGVPFNLASYSLLTHLLAQTTGLYAKEFILVVGDAHIYKNHIEQIKLQMKRDPRKLPSLQLDPTIKEIDDFNASHISFSGYNPHPVIKGKVSVGNG